MSKFWAPHLHAHTVGYLYDNFASGLVLVTNLFLTIALLRLATIRAGCDGDDECKGTVYGGFRPSSFLTTIIMCGQLSAALAMPLVGAVVDYTTWTRPLGAKTAWALAAVTVAQGVLLPLLLVVSLLQVLSIAAYVAHQVAVLAYLPTLSRDEKEAQVDHERHRINSQSVIAAFSALILGIVCCAAVAVSAGLGVVDTARLSQLSSGFGLVVIYGRFWHGYGSSALVEVPAKKVRTRATLWRQGLHDVAHSYAFLRAEHPDAGNFLLGYALANSSMTGFASLSIVFMNDHLELSPLASIAVILIVLLVSIPAAAAATNLMDAIGAKKTFVYSVVVMVVSSVVGPAILCGPSCASYTFAFAVVWGMAYGAYYSANTALYSELVPVGSEAQFMSLYYFAANLLTWAPPATYSILNQFFNRTEIAMYVLAFFFAISLPVFARIRRPHDAKPNHADADPAGVQLAPLSSDASPDTLP